MAPRAVVRYQEGMTESNRRRALELIASAPGDGVAEPTLLAQGITRSHLGDLVRDGLITVTTERLVSYWPRRDVAILRLSEAGRLVLAVQG
jgi:hypothetical protein